MIYWLTHTYTTGQEPWVILTTSSVWLFFGRYARKTLVFSRVPFLVIAWPRVLVPLNSLTLSYTWLHFVHERAVPIWLKCVLCSGWPSFSLCQVMLGGHWFSELFGDPDIADPSTITRTALDTLRDHLGIRQTPSLTVTRVHKVYTHICVVYWIFIPHYITF